MKKNLFWMAAFAVAMISVGCANDDDGGNEPTPPPVELKLVSKFTAEQSEYEGFVRKDEYVYTYNASKQLTRVYNTDMSPYGNTEEYTDLIYAAGKVTTSGKAGIGGAGERDQRPTTYTLNAAGAATKVVYGINADNDTEEVTDVEYDANGYLAKITLHLISVEYDPSDVNYENPIDVPYDDVYTFVYTNGNLTKITNEVTNSSYKSVYEFSYGSKVYENKASVDFFACIDIGCDMLNELSQYHLAGKRSAQIPVRVSKVEYDENVPGVPDVVDFVITTDSKGYITQYTASDETDYNDELIKFKFAY